MERNERMSKYDWDINEFMANERQVDGNYSYIDKFDDDDSKMLNKAYEAVVSFMKGGNLPHHIKERTLGYYYTFGLEGFFPRDVLKIRAFASTIVILDFKLRHSRGFQERFVDKTGDLIRDEELEINLEMFKELVQLCIKVKEKFLDPEAESDPKLPELFRV